MTEGKFGCSALSNFALDVEARACERSPLQGKIDSSNLRKNDSDASTGGCGCIIFLYFQYFQY